jgi:hypothetical protein
MLSTEYIITTILLFALILALLIVICIKLWYYRYEHSELNKFLHKIQIDEDEIINKYHKTIIKDEI